jgi:hypothetical protein
MLPVSVRDAGEIERTVSAFARSPNGGLIVTPTVVTFHRDLIITLAARYKLPAVYTLSYMVTGGGLISYGPDIAAQYRRASIASSRARSCHGQAGSSPKNLTWSPSVIVSCIGRFLEYSHFRTIELLFNIRRGVK